MQVGHPGFGCTAAAFCQPLRNIEIVAAAGLFSLFSLTSKYCQQFHRFKLEKQDHDQEAAVRLLIQHIFCSLDTSCCSPRQLSFSLDNLHVTHQLLCQKQLAAPLSIVHYAAGLAKSCAGLRFIRLSEVEG